MKESIITQPFHGFSQVTWAHPISAKVARTHYIGASGEKLC